MPDSYQSSAQIVRDMSKLLSVEGQIVFILLNEDVHISLLKKYVRTSKTTFYKKISEMVSKDIIYYVSRPKINGDLYLRLNQEFRNNIKEKMNGLLNISF